MSEEAKTCVRCGEVPPSNDPWHRGVGALSRTDNETMICSHCGHLEAMEDYSQSVEDGPGLTPQSQWPLTK